MREDDIAFRAKKFSIDWYERGYERGETQKFWRGILKKIFEVEEPDELINFEVPVPQGFIDAYLPATKVLIEQKSFGVDLNKIETQSDGAQLTPFEQALRYADALPENQKPRWIITCNFAEFRIYNFTENLFKPRLTTFKLRDLVYEYPRLKILIDNAADDSSPQERISKAALDDIEKIHKAFKANYEKNKSENFEDDLNKICTRLVFCLYAGDAKIFDNDKKTFDAQKFFSYILSFSDRERIAALQKIFDVFGLEKNKRAKNLDDDLKNFPYINGGLFDEKILLPAYNKLVTNPAATLGNIQNIKNFRWREISPPIFGAMFESKFSRREEQREQGMFYTGVENIHKVIDPLFLDDLRGEFEILKRKRKDKIRELLNFQDKLASLNFLDPACGSGNFLTETFLSLRRLENEVIEELVHLYAPLPANPIKVSPRQFYGIELDAFAVAVARLALSIADIQMKRETSWIVNHDLPELPLTKYISILKANALHVDWKKFAPEVNFIIGNPPYRGAMRKTDEQKADMRRIWGNAQGVGEMDYVSAWYKKATDCMKGSKIRAAFLATNSINQGQQALMVWNPLFKAGIHIDFAHQTFKWTSDSENMAAVHCVVVGFSSAPNDKPKKIFDGDKVSIAENINAYLVDAPTIFIESRSEPVCPVPQMYFGSMPRDGGHLIIKDDELDEFLRLEPAAQKYIRLYIGGEEFIKGKKRYCLWLVDCPPEEIKNMPLVAERVEACRKFRSLSKAESTRNFAATPHLFCQIAQPTTNYLLVPCVSSERRKYVPIGFMTPEIIVSNLVLVVPNAQSYHFGILTSSIHMAWMRAVAGRLKSDYRYSKDVVYNNFIWCDPTPRRRRRIESTAAEILKVRADFMGRDEELGTGVGTRNKELGTRDIVDSQKLVPSSSQLVPTWTFAKLYNENTMPQDLRDAHKENDMAVALAYGFEKFLEDEPRIVAELMSRYAAVTSD